MTAAPTSDIDLHDDAALHDPYVRVGGVDIAIG